MKLIFHAVIALRGPARGTWTIFGDDHFGIMGVCDAVIALRGPARGTWALLWYRRFCIRARKAYIAFSGIA